MAQQRVKTESALVVAPIALKEIGTEAFKAIILPAGAEVLGVNLEVNAAADASVTAKIGFNDDDDFFGSALDVATAGKNYAQGKVTTLNQSGFVTLTLSQAATKGEATLRVHFFYPTERMTEISIA